MDDAGCALRRALVKVVDVEPASAILMMVTRGTIPFMEATCGSSVTLLGSARCSHCDPLEEKEKYQTPATYRTWVCTLFYC